MAFRHFHFLEKRVFEGARHAVVFGAADRAFDDGPAACACEIREAFFQCGIAEFRPWMDAGESAIDLDERAFEFTAF